MFEILRETTCNILGEKELIFYDKNGQWLVHGDIKNKRVYISYERIWKVLEGIIGDNYDNSQSFIKYWLETNLGWCDLIPLFSVKLI
jgi:hypothetical protein